MKKRIVSLLLTAAMVFGLCGPIGGLIPEAGATEIIAEGDAGYVNLYWTLDSEGTFTLSGDQSYYDRDRYILSLPWGRYRNQIRRVVIDSGITDVPAYSFEDCTNLVEVVLSSSVTIIHFAAFRNCGSLASIQLSENLSEIEDSSFYGCSSLAELNIPDSCYSIGDAAFEHCTGLTTLRMHDDLLDIGHNAFHACKSLTKVVLPAHLEKMGNSAFTGCSNLKEVHWPLSLDDVYQPFGGMKGLTVYYEGTEADWNNIEVAAWTLLVPTDTRVIYNCKMPSQSGENAGDPSEPDEPEQDSTSIPTPSLGDPTCTEDGVRLTWNLPLELQGEKHTVDGYYILRKTAGGSYERIAQIEKGAGSNYTDTSVQEGQTYTYTVQAYYQGQTGGYHEEGKTITWTMPGVNGTDETMQVIVRPISGRWANMLPLYKDADQSGTFQISLSKKWVNQHPELFDDTQSVFHGSMKIMDEDGSVIYTQQAPLSYNGVEDAAAIIEAPIRFSQFTELPLEVDSTLTCALYDGEGQFIDSAEIHTSTFQRWSFGNYSTNIPDDLVLKMFGKSKGDQLLQQAKNSGFTMGDEGLCFGMSAVASLVNAGYISADDFDGCQVLDQVKKDTKISNIFADELIQMAHLTQYKPSVQAQLEQNKGDYDGLIDQLSAFKNGTAPMPLIYIEGNAIHAVCVYDYSEDFMNYYFYVFDASLMDQLGNVTVQKSNGSWTYTSWFGGKDTFTYCTVADSNSWTGLGEDHALLSTHPDYLTMAFHPNAINIHWIANGEQSARSGNGEALYWISGSKPVELSGPGSMADDHALYQVSSAESCTFAMQGGQIEEVSARGKNVSLDCEYPAENGTEVIVSYTGEGQGEETVALTYDPDENTVRVYGGDDGTVTVTYENGKTWTEQVGQDGEMTITADGEHEPSTEGTAEGEDIHFRDVPANAYYADAVQWAVEQGITTGTSSTTFSPDDPCTRAQVVTFIWRTLGLDELSSRSTENPFRDVPAGAYYRDPVLWAAENGITTGTSSTTFSPDDPCTRAQVVTFLWRTDYPPKKITGPVGFNDVHVGDYFWFPVKWALENEITSGTSENTFSPNQICTRAQVVTFLYRDFALR